MPPLTLLAEQTLRVDNRLQTDSLLSLGAGCAARRARCTHKYNAPRLDLTAKHTYLLLEVGDRGKKLLQVLELDIDLRL